MQEIQSCEQTVDNHSHCSTIYHIRKLKSMGREAELVPVDIRALDKRYSNQVTLNEKSRNWEFKRIRSVPRPNWNRECRIIRVRETPYLVVCKALSHFTYH